MVYDRIPLAVQQGGVLAAIGVHHESLRHELDGQTKDGGEQVWDFHRRNLLRRKPEKQSPRPLVDEWNE